jgi:2-methylcitrate dehydratase
MERHDSVLVGLAEFVAQLSYDDISGGAARSAQRMLLDALGCAYGAWQGDAPRIARQLAQGAPLADGATLIGTGQRVTPELACFANSALIRYLDYNDTYVSVGGVGHPSDYIPAVLAAGELADATGREVLTAIVATYEVFCRMVDSTMIGVDIWDHVTLGALAAAAGSAKALHLPVEKMKQALSIAAVANFALQTTRLGEVSMWKGCAAANAARNGLFASILARHGMTGPPAPFEGRGGINAALGRPVPQPLLGTANSSYAILGCHIKGYPAGFFSQTAIDAALELRKRHPNAKIEAVEVGVFPFGKVVMAGDQEKWRPATRESADHSIPYVVATALLRGGVQAEHFAPDELGSPEVVELLSRITVEEDPECAARWPTETLAKVRAKYADGTDDSVAVPFHRGHCRNPMTDDEVEAKFRRQASALLSEDEMRGVAEAVWGLDRAGSLRPLLDATTVSSLRAGHAHG